MSNSGRFAGQITTFPDGTEATEAVVTSQEVIK